jgi:hypothetical protein
VGVPPPQLDKVLQWTNVEGEWTRQDLGTTQHRKALLQAALLSGARRVWGARCRRMDTWWFSPAGAPARDALRTGLIRRAGARAAAAAEKPISAGGTEAPKQPPAPTALEAPAPTLGKHRTTAAVSRGAHTEPPAMPEADPQPGPGRRLMAAVLRVLDDANTTWPRIKCDGCKMHPIVGPRFTCTECRARPFDLCGACSAKGVRCSRNAGHIVALYEKRITKCGTCGAPGHNAQTCAHKVPTPAAEATVSRRAHTEPAAEPAANTQLDQTRNAAGWRMAAVLRQLRDINKRGDREGTDQGLDTLREEDVLTSPNPGFFITDDQQLAREVAEQECADRLDGRARNKGTGRLRLPWF